MKQSKNDQIISQSQSATVWPDDQSTHRLYAFFALLMKIDKRNNPKNYEYQKSRNSTDQTT